MQRIMVGVDGSKASEAALQWAARLAVHTGAKLVAVNSFQRPFAELPVWEYERLLDERIRLLDEEWVLPAVEIGAAVTGQVVEGDPRFTFTNLTESDAPDLLVLARSGAHGGPGFLHLGSVVEHVAHHTRCPLAIVPADAGGTITTIVVGVDAGEDTTAAARWCADTAPTFGARVLALTVREPVIEFTPAWDDENWRRDAERDARAAIRPIADTGVGVEVLVAEDVHPADALLDTASERDADLLVVGTRGAGGFSGLRFGGVAMKVLHRAHLPLVLVPPPSEEH